MARIDRVLARRSPSSRDSISPALYNFRANPPRFLPLGVHNRIAMKSKRRTSERRAEASRANGAKSRGPVTERGKYNSSLNSRRYGLLSRFLVLPGERPELFQEQYDDFMEEHQPRTPTERALVEEMVTSWWRKQRVWGMESARITFQVKLSSSMNYAVTANDPATRTALAVGDLADNAAP